MQSTNANLRIAEFLGQLPKHPTSALLLDYDGTLAPFRANRFAAFPYAGVTRLLSRIIINGRTRVVLISGRPAHEVQVLLGITPSPEIWGVHGMERVRMDGSHDFVHLNDNQTKILEAAESWLTVRGWRTLAEVKRGSIAIHWRGRPTEEAVAMEKELRNVWAPYASSGNASVLNFDGGLELRITGKTKGDAVLTVLQEIGPDAPIAYLGDDVTDEDAFRALPEKRGLAVLVRPEWRETGAQVWIKPPEELLEFLENWLRCSESAQ